MNLKWKLGEPFGIGVYVHWTFAALLVIVSFTLGIPEFNFVGNLLFYSAVFGSVLLHEFGHSLAARRYGIGTRDITLYPIGGVARLERMPSRPSEELVVALAGPAVNVVIAAVLFPFVFVGGFFGLFFQYVVVANVVLLVFNLLPAFPMDGGRVLRALLVNRHGMVKATNIAATAGKVMAVLFGVMAVFTFHPMLFLIALFVWFQGESERIRVAEAARIEREGPRPWPWGSFFQNRWQSPSQAASAQQVDAAPEWEVLPPEEQASSRPGKPRFHFRVYR